MVMPQDEAAARSEMLLRDAEEDLQRERLNLFWQQWGSTIIGMALMLVVGTAAGVGWREWRASENEQSTAALLQILSDPAAPLTDDVARTMGENQAAIAWLSRTENAKQEDLAKMYASAAEAGDDTVWSWLARWNGLRLRMDNTAENPAALIKDYEDLARDMKDMSLSALAYTDAAIIAGERMKDPAKALDYLTQAEKVVPRATPMSTIIADLKHLYEIRVQSSAATKENAS